MLSGFAWSAYFVVTRFSIIFPGIREIRAIRGQIRSFLHPGTGPGAAGQVVIDNCRSTEHHACGSPKERANPNDCQQDILSRKNGASHKHHKIKQLQQIITAVRHQGKTGTVNISMFFWLVLLRISKMDSGFFPALQNERQNPRRILSHTLDRSFVIFPIDWSLGFCH